MCNFKTRQRGTLLVALSSCSSSLARRACAAVGARSRNQARTFGFQSGSDPGAPAGALGPDSFGHCGFTGTSVWIAPRRPAVAVLLTNHVHCVRGDAPIGRWRRDYHGLAVDLLDEGEA